MVLDVERRPTRRADRVAARHRRSGCRPAARAARRPRTSASSGVGQAVAVRTSSRTCTKPGWPASRSISSAASSRCARAARSMPARSRGSGSSHSSICQSLIARPARPRGTRGSDPGAGSGQAVEDPVADAGRVEVLFAQESRSDRRPAGGGHARPGRRVAARWGRGRRRRRGRRRSRRRRRHRRDRYGARTPRSNSMWMSQSTRGVVVLLPPLDGVAVGVDALRPRKRGPLVGGQAPGSRSSPRRRNGGAGGRSRTGGDGRCPGGRRRAGSGRAS